MSKTSTSDFYCIECGTKGIPLPRKNNKWREPGHLKKMYCLYCKKKTNHCEIRPIGHYTAENFFEEFENGRFVRGVRIPLSKLKGCIREDCRFCHEGKC